MPHSIKSTLELVISAVLPNVSGGLPLATLWPPAEATALCMRLATGSNVL